jgi:MtaA/CmuA family methyltransferase
MTMNDRERLLALLAGESVDHRPFIVPGGGLSMAVAELIDDLSAPADEVYTTAGPMSQLALAAHTRAGLGNTGVPFSMVAEAEGFGAGVLPGTRVIEPRVSSYPLESVSDLGSLPAVDPHAGSAGAAVEAVRLLKAAAPDVPIIANISGGATLATSLVEPMVYFRAMVRERDAVKRLNALATEAVAAFGAAMLEAGADLVCIAESSATGDILGPAAFAEFVVPNVNTLIRAFHDAGVPVIFHACGDVRRLKDSFGMADADAFSVDSVVPISDLRALLPGRVTMGNVSTQLLHLGSCDAVREAAETCLRDGVDILAPACGISPKTPLANLACLAQVAEASGPWRTGS